MAGLPDILEEILAHKRREVAEQMDRLPAAEMERRAAAAARPRDMVAALRRAAGGPVRILGEIKRRSPSAGLIRRDFDPARLARGLEADGVDALSVLTDEKYFGGAVEFLGQAREACRLPVLRKDFIIGPYQIYEARAYGADAFLLIADALEPALLGELVELGQSLGMEALVEAHGADALRRAVDSGARLLGINNRDLRTFRVDLATTERLAKLAPAGCILVSESGVAGAADVSRVLAAGAQAVLVGESLMKARDPAALVRELKAAR